MTTITFWILMSITGLRSLEPQEVALPPFQTKEECRAAHQVLIDKKLQPYLTTGCFRMTMVVEGDAQ